jgi:hypothetical protein
MIANSGRSVIFHSFWGLGTCWRFRLPGTLSHLVLFHVNFPTYRSLRRIERKVVCDQPPPSFLFPR